MSFSALRSGGPAWAAISGGGVHAVSTSLSPRRGPPDCLPAAEATGPSVRSKSPRSTSSAVTRARSRSCTV
jgi:hypothetical protein